MSAFGVIATNNRGLSAAEIAELATNKIVAVSASAPEPIRQQAEAFRVQVRALLVHYIAMSKKAAITDLYNVMRDHGQHDAAAIILKLSQED